ncbi:MAG TPA: hypothetical protein VKU90_03285 [Caulobacteraceae bacterium]|nr:hypothetical protein [Caulobacteraceae bacterium]
MDETTYPIRYVLELCDTSSEHRPVAVFRASSPFPAVQVGDRFDDEGWQRLNPNDPSGTPAAPRRYVVHSVKHVVSVEGGSILARYCLNLTPHDGDRSPAWGDSPPVP